jgi:hypothetical protein
MTTDMNRGKKIFKIMGFVLLGLLAVAAFGFITMHLWNWLVPQLFNGPVISFWQTIGLLILSKIFFSGLGKGGHRHGGSWKPYWKERLRNMSPEDRERFKQKMKDKWCHHGSDASESSVTANG